MSGVFPAEALADPVRRAIVERLADGEIGAGEIAEAFPISRPAISRHLRVLRESGLVTSRVAGQHRIYALDRRPLAELDAWLESFRPLPVPGPARRLDALDTEIRRGRRARRATENPENPDQGDDRADTAG
ncbi:transcriptional regulator [Actinomycetospora sp. NBRC 106375]|uniref:ArsR/SmtB family transcription factor n=1 Tax=Actinomycetospora sp. NBRC 106375 TaxID=3032207 RepID=UPI0024A0E3EE|nr:transcriptional regulator [Actinomycetospora sp. NBRC 106375]